MIWRRSSGTILQWALSSKPCIDHLSIKCKSWRSQSRGAERRSRAGGSATGEDESRDTKTFLKKGLQREGKGESKRIISMLCGRKSKQCASITQTLHYTMLKIWSHKSCWCFEAAPKTASFQPYKVIKRGGGPSYIESSHCTASRSRFLLRRNYARMWVVAKKGLPSV